MIPPLILNQTNQQTLTFDVLVAQNADYYPQFTWQQDGVVQNLTGYSVAWNATSLAGVIFSWSSYVTLGTTNGLLTLRIPAAITGTLSTSDPPVRHELLLTSGTGAVTRLIEGTVNIDPG